MSGNAAEYCHCGRPLHYDDPELWAFMEKTIAQLGPYMTVQIGPQIFKVPRHYIALHGLKAERVPYQGFEEIIDNGG